MINHHGQALFGVTIHDGYGKKTLAKSGIILAGWGSTNKARLA
ncbi:MAG: hypothetical protein Q4A67_06955 [Aerococcus sp.]|nr:hypothetical protein [Aerococcus sp.]